GGPQLVVPINNARYAINAANARWGSLYDALYGSDIISEENGQEKGSSYNEKRGSIVIEQGRQFLDESTPLESGRHSDAKFYRVVNNELQVSLNTGETVGLKNKQQLKEYKVHDEKPAR